MRDGRRGGEPKKKLLASAKIDQTLMIEKPFAAVSIFLFRPLFLFIEYCAA